MKAINWKIFWLTLVPMFIIVTLKNMGIRPPQIFRPIPQHENIMFQTIRPLLEKYPNYFKLKKETSFIPKSYASEDDFEVSAYGTIDLETGTIIAEKNLSKKLPIASLTKVMTAVVTLDLAHPDEVFTVSPHASTMVPTKIGAKPGEKLTVNELLHAILMTSANDAAEILKEGVDEKYGSDVFIEAMNRKAVFLGLSNTHFDNAQGFDGDNYSTIEDLTILSHYALKNYPLIHSIVAKSYEFLPENNNHAEFKLNNWNGLIDVYPNVSGIKIGNTERAGRTTIVTSQREGKTLLTVILGAGDLWARDLGAATLLDDGFETFGIERVEVTKQQLQEKYDSWYF